MNYNDRDWGLTISAFGCLLLIGVLTLGALAVVAASIFFLVTGGSLGYILIALVALGFGCIFWSGITWSFARMVEG